MDMDEQRKTLKDKLFLKQKEEEEEEEACVHDASRSL